MVSLFYLSCVRVLVMDVAQIVEALSEGPALKLPQVLAMLDDWLLLTDRAQPVPEGKNYTEMHVVGLGLCALLHVMDNEEFGSFDLVHAMGAHADHVVVCDARVSEMSWQQVSDTVTAVQLRFKSIIEWDQQAGYQTDVDVMSVMLMLMKRAGYWLGHDWRTISVAAATDEAVQNDTECLHGIVDVDTEGWKCVRPACAVQFFDAVHAVLSLTRLLMRAQVVSWHTGEEPVSEHVRLFNHHREASIDDFYEMSMITDCMVGSITQYKHKFQFLFHSISQVVYYHWPVYDRQRQITQVEIDAYGVCGINLLPLLLQVDPEIPCYYEHTGAGAQSVYCKHEYSWAMMSGYVFMVHRSGAVFCSEDVRSLLLQSQHGVEQ